MENPYGHRPDSMTIEKGKSVKCNLMLLLKHYHDALEGHRSKRAVCGVGSCPTGEGEALPMRVVK
jgi:hypothetical protein